MQRTKEGAGSSPGPTGAAGQALLPPLSSVFPCPAPPLFSAFWSTFCVPSRAQPSGTPLDSTLATLGQLSLAPHPRSVRVLSWGDRADDDAGVGALGAHSGTGARQMLKQMTCAKPPQLLDDLVDLCCLAQVLGHLLLISGTMLIHNRWCVGHMLDRDCVLSLLRPSFQQFCASALVTSMAAQQPLLLQVCGARWNHHHHLAMYFFLMRGLVPDRNKLCNQLVNGPKWSHKASSGQAPGLEAQRRQP